MNEQKGLDRPELREKIAELIWRFTRIRTKAPKWALLEEFQKEIIRKQADQILALIPDIEELGSTFKRIEEAKREEGERMLIGLRLLLDKGFSLKEAISATEDAIEEQALKGEKQ
ncbi:hypothetical protein ES703_05391 [subsurface metagenome]